MLQVSNFFMIALSMTSRRKMYPTYFLIVIFECNLLVVDKDNIGHQHVMVTTDSTGVRYFIEISPQWLKRITFR